MAKDISLGVLVTPGLGKTQPFDAEAYLNASRGGFTDAEIKAGFDLVKPANHWKDPIDAIIDQDQQEIVAVAIAWFTACEAAFTKADNSTKVRVTAPGYFNGPAGP